jgi:CHAD domain-containing protein
MAPETKSLERPLRKLRKALKDFPKVPAPEEVHALRTSARRVEAAIQAFQLERKAVVADLFKLLKPIHRTAGTVRDMDVLVGFSSTLTHSAQDDCLISLLEDLAHRRRKAAAKLHRATVARRRQTRKSLKRCIRLLEDAVRPPEANESSFQNGSNIVAHRLTTELKEWPQLTATNLHDFRLKVSNCVTSFSSLRTETQGLSVHSGGSRIRSAHGMIGRS